MIGLSVEAVRRNEVRLGLRAVRHDVNPRVVRYHRAKTLEVLRGRGLV